MTLPSSLIGKTTPGPWMPIETAPKDGREVLVWRDDCGVLLARWGSAGDFLTEQEIEKSGMSDDDLGREDWFYADFISGGRMEGSEAPTCWMPLPSQPGAPLTFSDESESDAARLNPPKATPRPWMLLGPDEFGDYTISEPTKPLVIAAVIQNGFRSKEETAANAALIVQAVNGLPKLQRALAELVELLLDEHLLNRLDDALNAHPPLDPVRLVSLLRARDAARAALGEAQK